MEINKRYILASKIGNKTIINKIKWIVAKILNKLERFLIWIGYNWVGYKVDIKHNESEIIKLKKDIRALEICTTMAKNEYDNLKDSFNKYVLRKDNNNIDIDSLINELDDVFGFDVEDIYKLKRVINKYINLNN